MIEIKWGTVMKTLIKKNILNQFVLCRPQEFIKCLCTFYIYYYR